MLQIAMTGPTVCCLGRLLFARLRLTALAMWIATAMVVFGAVWPVVAETSEGLNVLFIMTDEQHYRSLSITGNPYIETPHMDRIAREGALFTQATCVTPYCSPSRASILTGLYPHTHGILLNVSPGRTRQHALRQDAFPNTETILHQSGYTTAHRGKWHLGNKGQFDCYESFGYASKTEREYRALLDARLPNSLFRDHPSPGSYRGRPVEMLPVVEQAYHEFQRQPNNRVAYIGIIGKTVIPPELLPETQITNQVIDLLEKHQDDRFMITVSWSPPHDLWVIPEPYYSMVDRESIDWPDAGDVLPWDEKGPSRRLGELLGREGIREYAAVYHGMVKYIDDQLGRILAKLDELGLAENTLVIFTSDHGDMVGAHGCVGKSIFSFYDDLVRIPLAIRLPGKIPAGTVIDRPVSQIDFMPTILDYLGKQVPQGIHGASLRPLIEGKEVPWRDYAFCQRANAGRMLRTDRYKLTCRPGGGQVALYDLKADPAEDHNLADDPAYAETLHQLRTRMLEIMERDGDPEVAAFRRPTTGGNR